MSFERMKNTPEILRQQLEEIMDIIAISHV